MKIHEAFIKRWCELYGMDNWIVVSNLIDAGVIDSKRSRDWLIRESWAKLSAKVGVSQAAFELSESFGINERHIIRIANGQ